MHHDLINYCKKEWHAFLNHDFVGRVADGSLDTVNFYHYLQQDFLFLKHYARAFALAIYKSQSLTDISSTLTILSNIIENEISAHVTYCKSWGLSEHALENALEDVATVAYTRYVLDRGISGDLTELHAALAPCALGYAEIGRRLINDPLTKLEGNPYRSWIELYASENSQNFARTQSLLLDHLIADIKPDSTHWIGICETFKTATRMEIAFWQQALDIKSGKDRN